jgi:hypothetical protein
MRIDIAPFAGFHGFLIKELKIRKYSLDVSVRSFKEGSKEMGLALGLLR